MATRKKYKTAGNPPLFKTPEQLSKHIQEYFDNPPIRQSMSKNGDVINTPFVSITGLCLALGFASRQSFYDYEKRGEYKSIIQQARLIVESEYEYRLQSGNTIGAIFALKNMGWTDD